MSSGSQRRESYGASLPHFLQTYSRELSIGLHTRLRFVVSFLQKSHLMEPTSLLGWQRCPLPLACFLHLGHSKVFTYSVIDSLLIGYFPESSLLSAESLLKWLFSSSI